MRHYKMTDKEKEAYEKQKLLAEKIALKRKQRAELREIIHSNDKKIQFGKLLTIIGYIDIGIIQLFCMFAIIYLRDASSLYALIGLVATIIGEISMFHSYNKKSTAENISGGIVYESMMKKDKEQDGDVG